MTASISRSTPPSTSSAPTHNGKSSSFFGKLTLKITPRTQTNQLGSNPADDADRFTESDVFSSPASERTRLTESDSERGSPSSQRTIVLGTASTSTPAPTTNNVDTPIPASGSITSPGSSSFETTPSAPASDTNTTPTQAPGLSTFLSRFRLFSSNSPSPKEESTNKDAVQVPGGFDADPEPTSGPDPIQLLSPPNMPIDFPSLSSLPEPRSAGTPTSSWSLLSRFRSPAFMPGNNNVLLSPLSLRSEPVNADGGDDASIMLYSPLIPSGNSLVEIAESRVVEVGTPRRPKLSMVSMQSTRSGVAERRGRMASGLSKHVEEAEEVGVSAEQTQAEMVISRWRAEVAQNQAAVPRTQEDSRPREWIPSAVQLSVQAMWWGYRLYLPPPILAHLTDQTMEAARRASILTAALTWLLNNVPPEIESLFPSFVGLLGVLKSLVPIVGYVGAAVGWSWAAVRGYDRGHGVILTATWVLPFVLIPSSWDIDEFPCAPPPLPPKDPTPDAITQPQPQLRDSPPSEVVSHDATVLPPPPASHAAASSADANALGLYLSSTPRPSQTQDDRPSTSNSRPPQRSRPSPRPSVPPSHPLHHAHSEPPRHVNTPHVIRREPHYKASPLSRSASAAPGPSASTPAPKSGAMTSPRKLTFSKFQKIRERERAQQSAQSSSTALPPTTSSYHTPLISTPQPSTKPSFSPRHTRSHSTSATKSQSTVVPAGSKSPRDKLERKLEKEVEREWEKELADRKRSSRTKTSRSMGMIGDMLLAGSSASKKTK